MILIITTRYIKYFYTDSVSQLNLKFKLDIARLDTFTRVWSRDIAVVWVSGGGCHFVYWPQKKMSYLWIHSC